MDATIQAELDRAEHEMRTRAGILVELIENSLEQMRASLFMPTPIHLWIGGRRVGTISHRDGGDGTELEFTPAAAPPV